MKLSEAFSTFCENICLDNYDSMETSVGEIAKKLNSKYYGLDGDSKSHMYIVGSVGRNTAIKNSSDLDILFDLPNSVFKRFDDYDGNGQSQLLQEIKNTLSERYPKTDLRGDGQVVVIGFSSFTVELVPGFKQKDDTFKYPDTHFGGMWKTTDPLSEQKECAKCDKKSNNNYYNFCHIIRCMKNNKGFNMGGLLIDTLVYNHFVEQDYYSEKTYGDYDTILLNVLDFLKKLDKNQTYWFAVGSNQHVDNTDNGKWIKNFQDAYDALNKVNDDEEKMLEELSLLFGKNFPKSNKTSEVSCSSLYSREQFIEDMFPVDIRYSLKIECIITQDGWRPTSLRDMLRKKQWLRHNKKLDFYIDKTNCPKSYEICWKVRNVGEEAVRRNCIRGEIKKTNNNHQIEHTNFYGPHYVECYIIKNGICVARDRIDVPIGWE